MRMVIVSGVLLLSLAACQNGPKNQEDNLNISNSKKTTAMESQITQTAIEKSLSIYFDALNKSNVQQAVGQYTEDGVFMPTGFPTASGTSELTTAYENVFKAIQLNVTFNVEEIVSLDDNVAFVRTQSSGTQLIQANSQKTEELNREFFLMKKDNGVWKIARYMFNQPK
ncbi:nuclear transport factor 2 family protein [Pedobacter gandavensis]|uniref:YybH family protein n=1 Tax=Pedobacter gandavensis TaxID=2679963 RepID=UPI00293058C8|nr:nuclear transport factor 2 family protein [Pedobacter gandavensis]